MQRRTEEENYRYLIVILWPRNQPRIKSEDGMSRESKSWPSSCQTLRSQLTENDETNRIWNLPVAVLWFPWDDIMNIFMWFYIMNFFGQNVWKRRLQAFLKVKLMLHRTSTLCIVIFICQGLLLKDLDLWRWTLLILYILIDRVSTWFILTYSII